MKCRRCQQDNATKQKFCGECGTPLRAVGSTGVPERSYADVTSALSEALEKETATAEILQVISQAQTDLQPVMDAIAESALRLFGAWSASLFRYDGEFLQMVSRRQSAEFGDARPLPWRAAGAEVLDPALRLYRPTGEWPADRAVLERAVQHFADVETDPLAGIQVKEWARAHGWRSLLQVPMMHRGDAIGVVAVTRAQPGGFAPAEITLLKSFAHQAVIAIENVRLFKELEARNRDLTAALEQQTATSEILKVISSSPTDLQPVLAAVAENAARVCGAIDAQIYRVEGESLRWVASHGPIPPLTGLRPINREWVTGRAVVDRCSVHVHDLAAESVTEYPIGKADQAQTGHRTTLATPLLREGVPLGAIVIRRLEVAPFSDKQIGLLKTFADQAVIAIENVRLFTELQEKNKALTDAHEQVSEALERQTATSEILRVISSSPTSVEAVFDTILANALRLCETPTGGIFTFDGRAFHLAAAAHWSDEFLAALREAAIVPGPETPLRRVGITLEVSHVADIFGDPSFSPPAAYRLEGMRTSLAVPMLKEGRLIGALTFHRREVRPFTEAQIALIKIFADQAVIAIENVRLFRELEVRNRDLTEALDRQTATAEVLRVISRSHVDVRPVFGAILDSAVRLCTADLGAICTVESGHVVPVAISPSTPDRWAVIRKHYPRPVDTTSTLGRAVAEARVIHIPDFDDPQAEQALTQVVKGLGFKSQLTVPMIRAGQPIGVLALNRLQPGPFAEAQIELVQAFADQAVIAIENARLLTELQARTQDLTRSVEQLTALGEVGRAVSSTLDVETVLTTIVSRAVELSGLDGGVVSEYDEAREEFIQRAAAQIGGALAEALREVRYRKGEGAIGRTAITREPVQVPDITVPGAYHSRTRENLIESGVKAVLAVPMIHQDRLIGCLGVTRNRPGEFPAETIELLRRFATQSALAIQNARLFREIEDKSRQLEVASQHKSEFLANMSHELRTPLNAIIGFSEVLAERMFGELNDKQEEYLKDIHASGQHLLSLINDILDLSKIEAGRMELELTDFHLPTALDNALTLVRERAGRRGIALHMTTDERLDYVRADERKIRQVVLNLLSNAIKFTPEGGRIEVQAKPVDGAVEVAVTDTGVGIAPEDQEAIFEEFRQVGTADKKVEGTGLGLALSRKFIELHGGRIWVESQVGAGSTFTFTIPVRHGE
jgi:signal transduction histidine kinase